MKGNQTKPKLTQIKVLSAGLGQEDCDALAAIFGGNAWSSCADAEWKLEARTSVSAALAAIAKDRIAVVLCEREIGVHSWQELLDQASQLSNPPCVIVTSRLADDYLWAEALNLGAYDVLARPFEPAEVVRVLSSAWLHRQHRSDVNAKPMRLAGAARVVSVAV